MIQCVKFENRASTYILTGKLECNYKMKMKKIFSLKCLLHIIVTAVVLHLLLNTKIMKFIITPEEEYRSSMRDDRIYIDMRRS